MASIMVNSNVVYRILDTDLMWFNTGSYHSVVYGQALRSEIF